MATKEESGVKLHLVQWSKVEFGEVTKQKEMILDNLSALAIKEESGQWNPSDILHRKNLENDFSTIQRREELMWQQRSKVKWLREGDNNTKYFHKIASGRKRRNCLVSIKDRDKRHVGQVAISQHVINYFKTIFSGQPQWELKVDWTKIFPALSGICFDDLVKPFQEDEVFSAITNMNSSSAPGPDGFLAIFFKRGWPFLKANIMNMFDDLYLRPNTIKSLS